MFHKAYISVILLCLIFNATAQDSTKRLRIEPLPSIFHTPETSWGFGATLLGYVSPADSFTSKSNFQIFLDATLMRQASFQTDFSFFTKNNKHYIQGSSDLSKFPEFYYGIGNENEESERCLINLRYFNTQGTFYTALKNDWHLGPLIHLQGLAVNNKVITHDGFEVDDMGYFVSGAGFSLLSDKRNNLLNPSQGHYISTSLAKYFDHTRASSGYLSHSLDARYFTRFDRTIFNSNLYTVHNSGIVPFRMMPAIGGARFLRGYYAGRFRDNNMTLAQIEFRRPLFWRIGVAAFTGVAQVYSEISEFHPSRFHYNYGGGLRFKLNKHSEANIRLDYGRTEDSDGFYIVFGECF